MTLSQEKLNVRLRSLMIAALFAFPVKADTKTKATEKREEGEFTIEKRGDTTIKYKKKATYDFEGANIDGLYNKPSGSYISNIKDVKGKSLIRMRENFDAEVIDSTRQLK